MRFVMLALSLLTALAHAQSADRFAGVEVKAQPVAGNVYMLTGAGGNIGVSVGDDGTLIVDDQFAPLAERILAAIRELGGAAPTFVLNTHFHGDHTGGNAFFGRTGIILAHQNVRVRLLADDSIAARALPVITYDDRIRLYFNGDEIEVMHLPHGHTDGDSVVWFKNAGVVHMGDLFFVDRFPFIDIENGGSVTGYAENIATVLSRIPADTRIIPGHGPLSDTESLAALGEAIRTSHAQVRRRLASGESLDEIIEAGLDGDYDTWASGFIDEESWIRTLAAGKAAVPAQGP